MTILLNHVMLLGFMGIGPPEFVIFLIVLLVLFGGAKLPGLMRNMGRSVNEFKAGIKEKPQDVPREEDSHEALRKVEKKDQKEYSETN